MGKKAPRGTSRTKFAIPHQNETKKKRLEVALFLRRKKSEHIGAFYTGSLFLLSVRFFYCFILAIKRSLSAGTLLHQSN